jgi:hypothetical protein
MGYSNKFDDRKRRAVLVAATLRWPLSARLAMRFLEYGCRVSAICPKGHFLRYVEGLDRIFPYRGVSSLDSLEKAIRETAPDIIIPCDDRVVWQLHELHNRRPDLRPVIEASLGAAEGFKIIQRRDLLLETARALGIRIPATRRATSEEDVHRWFAEGQCSAVLKLDGTWGGEGVAIAHSEQEAINAFRQFSRPTGLGTALKRFVVNHDPLSLWSWSKQSQPVITVQQLIEGQPTNSMLACWKGEVLAVVSVEVLASQGATGAAFLVRIIENDEMTKAAHSLAGRLQLTGFVGLDFLIDQVTGQTYMIEMNPRCTQLGHLPLTTGCDLAGALCTQLGCGICATNEASTEGRPIAFFPQATRWGAKISFADDVYEDIPQGQPELVRELLRPGWSERHWISRTYHFFHPPRAIEPVEFRLEADRRKFTAEDPVNCNAMDTTHK